MKFQIFDNTRGKRGKGEGRARMPERYTEEIRHTDGNISEGISQ